MKRTALKRRPVRRDWSKAIAKIEFKSFCLGCKRSREELAKLGRPLQAAHTIGRTYDLKLPNGGIFVDPDSVVALCGPATDTATCHCLFDAGFLNLWELLNLAERAWAVNRVGEGQARRKIEGRP